MQNNLPPFASMRNRIVRGIRKVVDLPIGLGSRRWRPTGESPLVTIVVASYNYQDLIRETLDSLLAQTYTNFEVLVVDDGSRDNSVQVIQEYCRRDSRIRLLQHPGGVNRGLPATVRLGIDSARGEWIAFCESDDVWLPQHLQRKIDIIRRYRNVGVVTNELELFGDPEAVRSLDTYMRVFHRYVYTGGCYIDQQMKWNVNFIPTFSCAMVRATVLRQADFDTPIAAWLDFWLWRQILRWNLLYFVPEPLTRWRMHKDSFNATTTAQPEQSVMRLVYLSIVRFGMERRFFKRYASPRTIRGLKKHGLFDADYYTSRYDIESPSRDDAIWHYILYGWQLGYDPTPTFSTAQYISRHPEVVEEKQCPVLDYYYTNIRKLKPRKKKK